MPRKTKVRTREEILADNAKYNALPPLKKRVATAKEILKEVKLGIFVPDCGYGAVTIPEVYNWRDTDEFFPVGNLQEHIQKKGFQCEGCAKAAVIVARAKLGNNVVCHGDTTNDVLANEVSYEIFGEKCANIIEALYESYRYRVVDETNERFYVKDSGERDAVIAYMGKLPLDLEERLVAIYQNIITNRGHLVIGGYKF